MPVNPQFVQAVAFLSRHVDNQPQVSNRGYVFLTTRTASGYQQRKFTVKCELFKDPLAIDVYYTNDNGSFDGANTAMRAVTWGLQNQITTTLFLPVPKMGWSKAAFSPDD